MHETEAGPKGGEKGVEQADDDAAFVAETAGQPTGRQGHQEVAEVVGKLDVGGLGFGQMQEVLKVFVHHVDHAIAHRPQEKQRGDEQEGETVRLPIGGLE